MGAGPAFGAEFVARHRGGWLAGADAALSELGVILDQFALTRPIAIIGVSEKTSLPLRLTAHGIPGHGSLPWPDTAPQRLVRAVHRLLEAERRPRVLPESLGVSAIHVGQRSKSSTRSTTSERQDSLRCWNPLASPVR